jgi:type I restriction enzyme M protein
LPLYPGKQSAAALSREKTGAEFPFTRYFYEYQEPEKSDALLKRFMELENSIGVKVKELGGKE